MQEPSHLIDIMATCVDVANAEYPQQFNSHDVQPLEGQSLKPLLQTTGLPANAPPFAKRTLFWEHEGNRAVRRENLKLVAKEDQPWELYDIAKDRGEQHDLAETHPELVATMAAAWDAWATRAKVLPLGTWKKQATGEAKE